MSGEVPRITKAKVLEVVTLLWRWLKRPCGSTSGPKIKDDDIGYPLGSQLESDADASSDILFGRHHELHCKSQNSSVATKQYVKDLSQVCHVSCKNQLHTEVQLPLTQRKNLLKLNFFTALL